MEQYRKQLYQWCAVPADELENHPDRKIPFRMVKDSVEMLRKHPLIPKDVKISGYVMDSVTGELHVVEP